MQPVAHARRLFAVPPQEPAVRHTITAAAIMTADVVTVSRSTKVVDAADLMIRNRVSNAPVVEVDFTRNLLAGFVSEKDLMQCYASGQVYVDPALQVDTVMRPYPISVKPETDLFTLAAIFMQHGFRHIPVTVGQVLQGMVSRRDVLAALSTDHREWQKQDPAKRELPDLASAFTSRYLLG
jgi:CBS domain-containing protein